MPTLPQAARAQGGAARSPSRSLLPAGRKAWPETGRCLSEVALGRSPMVTDMSVPRASLGGLSLKGCGASTCVSPSPGVCGSGRCASAGGRLLPPPFCASLTGLPLSVPLLGLPRLEHRCVGLAVP